MGNAVQRLQLGDEVSKSRAYKIEWARHGRCSNCGAIPLEGKKRCQRCLDNAREQTRSRRKTLKGVYKTQYHARKGAGTCPHCGENPSRDGGVTCSVCYREEWGYRIRVKARVISKYGGSCVCCGELNVMFLSLDHIDGGGTKERSLTGKKGGGLYKKLDKLPVDSRYQVLCYNCNFGKGDRNQCPHMYMKEVQEALNWVPKAPRRKRKYA